jgi:hypothetical protein
MAPRKKIIKLAVGDHVRLSSYKANQHTSYLTSPAFLGLSYEPVDGLILSIRDLRTGKLTANTTGALDGHIIELVYDATFNSRYASSRNFTKGVEQISGGQAWKKLRETLRREASEGRLFSTSTEGGIPVARLMDGFKVVKVRSTDLVSLEQEPEAATPETA